VYSLPCTKFAGNISIRGRYVPERLRGVLTTRRYTNPRLLLPYLADCLCVTAVAVLITRPPPRPTMHLDTEFQQNGTTRGLIIAINRHPPSCILVKVDFDHLVAMDPITFYAHTEFGADTLIRGRDMHRTRNFIMAAVNGSFLLPVLVEARGRGPTVHIHTEFRQHDIEQSAARSVVAN